MLAAPAPMAPLANSGVHRPGLLYGTPPYCAAAGPTAAKSKTLAQIITVERMIAPSFAPARRERTPASSTTP